MKTKEQVYLEKLFKAKTIGEIDDIVCKIHRDLNDDVMAMVLVTACIESMVRPLKKLELN